MKHILTLEAFIDKSAAFILTRGTTLKCKNSYGMDKTPKRFGHKKQNQIFKEGEEYTILTRYQGGIISLRSDILPFWSSKNPRSEEDQYSSQKFTTNKGESYYPYLWDYFEKPI